MGKVVLITGVSRLVGGMTAQRLSLDPDIDRVIAVDAVPPTHSIGNAQFVRADIRNPMIGRIIAHEKVDTVLHLGVIMTPRQAGGRTSQKDINVIGTMQLLAACQRAESLQRLVVKSSSAVYGSSPGDPAMFTEEMQARHTPVGGFGKDSAEVENYVRGFARRRPDVQVCTLRMANVIDRSLRTPLADYFSMPVLPVPLGFDGRFQVLHLEDALEALRTAALSSLGGTINVAADGILTVRQAARIARKPFVPVLPFTAAAVQQVGARLGLGQFDANQMPFLCFGRGMDTTRMRTDLGFEPAMTTREAFTDVFAPAARRAAVAMGAQRG
ncbi:NAD-dependent epimerase/dehydratase family protein [Calidifontibacter sp. DB0510]|uniref:NAD-dependent epimerase/dehydratase family protein n=1 Tax=Metallococcus carri TaxID=1656884 RepID=A0A967B0U1_9MICO|nr:NAD-dependent epimerase/dehydratase family protein [Metallococcus carri]NHN55325.1 NAD-dependent epimerase/dehydratase family protein [Metallococcus carri]NOP36402.1 NAD-dependent epimerase/dehydratase family protein [Calidifontibacter sp. DB2511S]